MNMFVQLGPSSLSPETKIQLDEEDITDYVRSILIKASVHELTEVTIELIGTPAQIILRDVPVTQQFRLPFLEEM